MNKDNREFYTENGYTVFTELYHRKRGFCCGNKCRHCCYDPKHIKGNQNIKESKTISDIIKKVFKNEL